MFSSRYFFLLYLITAIPSLVFAESDITGWGKVKWGMTHSEVKKLYELNDWESGNSPIINLKKKITIGDHNFAVAFYFDERSASGKLYKVALAHFDRSNMNASWLNSIKNILVKKYGDPSSFDVKNDMKVSMWTKSAGQVKLTTLTGKTVMCAIEYFSAFTESEKL